MARVTYICGENNRKECENSSERSLFCFSPLARRKLRISRDDTDRLVPLPLEPTEDLAHFPLGHIGRQSLHVEAARGVTR